MSGRSIVTLMALVLCGAPFVRGAPATRGAAATAPTTRPVKVDVTRKDEVDAAVDKDVVFTARVESAQWTSTGRMLLIRFAGAPDNFRGVGYQKQREALDKAFDGDFAAAIAGKDVEVSGRLRRYKGTNAEWKDVVEVPITRPGQVKIVTKKD